MKTKNTLNTKKENKKIDFRFFLKYLKNSKGILFLAVITSILCAVLVSSIPKISAKVINTDLANMQNAKLFLIKNGIIFITLALLYGVLFYLNNLLFNKLANRTCYFIQMDLANRLVQLKIKIFDTITSGNIMSRFSSDVNAVRDMYAFILSTLISSGTLLIVLYINLIFINIYVFLVFLVYVPIVVLVARLYLTKTDKPVKIVRKKNGEMSGFLNESLKAMESIKAYERETEMQNEFEKINSEVYKHEKKFILYNGLFSWNIIQKMEQILNVCLLLLFGYLYFNNSRFPIGTLFIIISYNSIILKYFMQVFLKISMIKTSFTAAQRISEVINFEAERTNGNQKDITGNIEFKNVNFEYKESTPVLSNLSFTLPHGKTMAFVGKTGCGKSTIMNLILGFYESKEGQVLIDGIDIKEIELKFLRKNMAVVLQEPYLFTGTILDNIHMGNNEISESEVEEALIAVGGEYLLQKAEKGIHSEVKENGKNFSQGERQIICFARAMVKNPKILILDEASSNIDTETEKLINKGIEVLKKGRTTLIIAHRLSTIKNVDCISLIQDGKIIEQGTHEELMELNQIYAEWCRIQRSGKANA